MDADRDSSCDICSADILRFSVTVPAMLVMTMAEDGYVYQAANAEIINNSTFEVEISSVTVTAGADWTIVPYDTWMSDEKVDSRLIGFSLNGVATKGTGYSEALNVPRNWIIDNGSSFPLEYDAVVSATSEILQNEQVLTVVFVFSWALR